MLLPGIDTENLAPLTWAKLKDFCNQLSDEQLQQEVIVPQDQSYIKILYASDLGEDQYNFIDEKYSCTKEDYDAYNFEGISFEEALEKYDYSITPGTNVYLFDE